VSASLATGSTLPHQASHVLGLNHVDGVDRLMTTRSNKSITSTVAEIVAGEVAP
jgi:hypothetical protein